MPYDALKASDPEDWLDLDEQSALSRSSTTIGDTTSRWAKASSFTVWRTFRQT
jgi:hypothetical protein